MIERIFGLMVMLTGMAMTIYPIASLARKKMSETDRMFALLLGAIFVWQVTTVAAILNTNVDVANAIFASSFMAITLTVIILYMLAITLKRSILISDIIVTFPILAGTGLYIYGSEWVAQRVNGYIIYSFMNTSFLFWLCLISLISIFSIKTLNVLLTWLPPGKLKLKMQNFTIAVIVAFAFGISVDSFLFPTLIIVPISSAIVGAIMCIGFINDKAIKAYKLKTPKRVKEMYPRKDTIERIKSFL